MFPEYVAFNLKSAALQWLLILGVGASVALLFAFIRSFILYGMDGPNQVGREIVEGLSDFFSISPRRVGALTMLTVREAIRRKALLVFVVFGILFLFGGWFLTQSNDRPELQVKVYVSFVLTAIQWLILPVVLLLACWGLPEDIKARSLHTVVTKPARRNEVVLGRMLGFITVGTMVLAVMSIFGYVWLVRQVPDSAQSQLVCRVPVYGALKWKDREGNEATKGINTGDIWEFRGYIEGATRGRAIWTFPNVTPADMVLVQEAGKEPVERLRVESRFQAFRTYKGNMNRSLLGQITLVNAAKKIAVPLKPFELSEFGNVVTLIDRKLSYDDDASKSRKTVDLFDDLTQDGNLTMEVRCLDASQFIGMAQPDLFLRKPDLPFASGYFKAILGIWLMMALIVVLGVTASTFVKGPVAMILTFFLLILGSWFHSFLDQMVKGTVQGGGAIESLIRIYDHKNPMVELDPTARNRFIKQVDKIPFFGLQIVSRIVPNFDRFKMSEYVANGFDVPFTQPVPPYDSALLPAILSLAAFTFPCLLLAYYSLKLRELESK